MSRIPAAPHFYEQAAAVTISIEENELRVGDRIAFELPIEFEEQSVDSLQIESETVEVAGIGGVVGILTAFSKGQMKKGVRVFRVKP